MPVYSGFSSVPQINVAVTANLAEIPTATATKVAFTVPGATPGMFFVIAAPSLEDGLSIGSAYCAVAGTVQVLVVNPTVGPINPASQVFYFLGL